MNPARFSLLPEYRRPIIATALPTVRETLAATLRREFPDAQVVGGRWLNGPPGNWLDRWWNPDSYPKSTFPREEARSFIVYEWHHYRNSNRVARPNPDGSYPYGSWDWKTHARYSCHVRLTHWWKWSRAKLAHSRALGES